MLDLLHCHKHAQLQDTTLGVPITKWFQKRTPPEHYYQFFDKLILPLPITFRTAIMLVRAILAINHKAISYKLG